MRLKTVRTIIASSTALLMGLFLPQAHAAYLDCLESSKGQTISWSSSWGEPFGDQDIEYQVVAVRVKNVMPERSVTLELSTDSTARSKRRTLFVDTEERARSICERIVLESRPLTLPGDKSSRFTSNQQAIENLPHIEYSLQVGWVRGKTPRSKRLAVCKIQDQEFSCLEDDKLRYGSVLTLVEEELRTGVK